MTFREELADDLARARTRTLRLVDFDDAELFRQYDRACVGDSSGRSTRLARECTKAS